MDANQAGNDNYNAAPQVQQSFYVNPAPATHLVISEFSSRGPGGENDEFVEIYNPTGGTINISSWTIRSSGSCTLGQGQVVSTLVTFGLNTTLQPGQHYLVASSVSTLNDQGSSMPPDKTYIAAPAEGGVAGIDDDGGVALVNLGGQIQDAVGTCVDTKFHEGTVLTPFSSGDYNPGNPSYERKPGGATSCYDTNDNFKGLYSDRPGRPAKFAQRKDTLRRRIHLHPNSHIHTQPHAHAHACPHVHPGQRGAQRIPAAPAQRLERRWAGGHGR